MKHSAKLTKILLLGALAFGLSACDEKEDFSGLGEGCAIGNNCRVEASGPLLVELSGPVVGGLGYTCGSSTEYIKLEESETKNDYVIPPGMAACPADAKDITFYIGRATDEGNHIELGKAYIPIEGRAELHAGSDREILRITWADVVESPRRVGADKLGNRLAILAAMDNGTAGDLFTQPPVEFPVCANDALDRYLEDEGAAASLKSEVNSGDLTNWSAAIEKLNSVTADDDKNKKAVCEGFNSNSNGQNEDALKDSLAFAMNATRAGTIDLSYQDEALLAHLVDEGVDLAPNPLHLGQVSGSLHVFPDGAVKGFSTATVFIRDNANAQEGDIRRDLLGVSTVASLSDELGLNGLELTGLEIKPPKFLEKGPEESDKKSWHYQEPGNTELTVGGTFFGVAVFDGVVWEPKEVKKNDVEVVYPQIKNEEMPKEGEFGRFEGDYLGYPVSRLLANDGSKAPIRVVRSSYGSTQMHKKVFEQLEDKNFTLTLMHVCEQDGGDGCSTIEAGDKENYPTTLRYEEGLNPGQGGTDVGMVEIKDLVFNEHKKMLTCEAALEDTNGHLYVNLECGDGDNKLSLERAGYISHTEVYKDEGATLPESAIFTMIFDSEALQNLAKDENSSNANKYLYGVEIQGRLDLRECSISENRFYRLSDDNFRAKQSATWIGNFWALKGLESVASDTDAAIKPALIHAQGSAYLTPSSCP